LRTEEPDPEIKPIIKFNCDYNCDEAAYTIEMQKEFLPNYS